MAKLTLEVEINSVRVSYCVRLIYKRFTSVSQVFLHIFFCTGQVLL